MKFNLIFCTSFSKLSKHLEFLSFQIVHQIQAGTILHLLLSLACEQFLSSVTSITVLHTNEALLSKLISQTEVRQQSFIITNNDMDCDEVVSTPSSLIRGLGFKSPGYGVAIVRECFTPPMWDFPTRFRI